MAFGAIKKLIPLSVKIWLKARLPDKVGGIGGGDLSDIPNSLSPQRLAILRHMEGIFAQRPLDIALETITVCNARCVFCAYRKTKRETEVMSMELYKKILDEYAQMGGGPLGFAPYLADPLLDPKLFDRLKMAKEYGVFILHTFTNGIRFAKFTEDQLEEYVSSMDTLNISMGGLDREEYQKMFGVDKFDEVWSSLERISTMVKRKGLKTRVQIHFRTHDQAALEQHPRYKQLGEMGIKHIFIMTSFNSWGGVVTQEDLPGAATILKAVNSPPIGGCAIPVTEMTILPNGDVAACGCYDGKLQTLMGNVAKDSVAGVWQGEAYTAFRKHFMGQRLHPLCEKCGFYIPYENLLSNPGLEGYQPKDGIFWSRIS